MHPETLKKIESALRSLTPSHLKVVDNSHLHVGHEGAKSGGGHFAVEVVSEAFDGLSRIKRHQLVYQKVDALFQDGLIHALEITAQTKEEFA